MSPHSQTQPTVGQVSEREVIVLIEIKFCFFYSNITFSFGTRFMVFSGRKTRNTLSIDRIYGYIHIYQCI